MSYISPLTQYQNLIHTNKITIDDCQKQGIEQLENLYLSLLPSNIIAKTKSSKSTKSKNDKGIYLWGKVGRGKTFLMDLFVNSLPSSVCKRQHFHHFMKDVHEQLRILSGKPEPLKLIAQQFSKQYQVLCFDEFFVSDIGDAMLLGNLLQYMFELNIIVVCTSNCAPHELYRNGLQRERFLPAIAAIEKHCLAIHLSGMQDHRHRSLTHVQNYYQLPESLEQQTNLHQLLLTRFHLAGSQQSVHHVSILARDIKCIALNEKLDKQTICFEFSELCQGPRSHLDYVELAKTFKTILIFNVPPMSGHAYERIKARGTEDNGSNINISASTTGEREIVLAPMDDAVRRFIALIDECYDCQINLVLTAYVAQDELYNSGSLMFEFERTKSRLFEMASQEYLDKSESR